MFGLGTTEIILILLAILVLFGARKIPEFARGLGQGIREFKNAASNVQKDIATGVQADEQKKQDTNTANTANTPNTSATDKTLQ